MTSTKLSLKELGVIQKSRTNWAVVLWDEPDTVVCDGVRSNKKAHEIAKRLMQEAHR